MKTQQRRLPKTATRAPALALAFAAALMLSQISRESSIGLHASPSLRQRMLRDGTVSLYLGGRPFLGTRRAIEDASVTDASIWADARLWSAHCLALYPGLQRPPIHAEVADMDPAFAAAMTKEIPVYVLSFDNPTYVHQMVRFLRCYGLKVVLVDHGSTLPRHLALLRFLESYASVERRPANLGPHSLFERSRLEAGPRVFAVTDADIRPNPHTPPNFVSYLANLTQIHNGHKAGFALDLSLSDSFKHGEYKRGKNITTWEAEFWEKRLPPIPGNSDPMFEAYIDTTFAVYDRDVMLRRYCPSPAECVTYEGVRVAGTMTATHLPWLCFSASYLSQDELDNFNRMSANFSDTTRAFSKTDAKCKFVQR